MGQDSLPTGPWTGYLALLTGLLAYAAAHMEQEMATIAGAPSFFILAVVIAGVALWGAFRFRHGQELSIIPTLRERIELHKEEVKRRDEEIARLDKLVKEAGEKNQLPAPSLAAITPPIQPTRPIQPTEKEKALLQIDSFSLPTETPPIALRKCLKHGYELLCLYSLPERASDQPWREWVTIVASYLQSRIKGSAAARWGSHEGLTNPSSLPVEAHGRNRKLHADISFRIQRLEEFLREWGN